MHLDVIPTVPYSKEFFNGLTEKFLEHFEISEENALDFFRNTMKTNLDRAYDGMKFKKGLPEDFARVVGERDKSVGLHVSFDVYDDKIIYRFHTDPFPKLKGSVGPHKLDATYMDFKVSYLLGPDWHYKTTKHLWNGDDCTEHVIEKK